MLPLAHYQGPAFSRNGPDARLDWLDAPAPWPGRRGSLL